MLVELLAYEVLQELMLSASVTYLAPETSPKETKISHILSPTKRKFEYNKYFFSLSCYQDVLKFDGTIMAKNLETRGKHFIGKTKKVSCNF